MLTGEKGEQRPRIANLVFEHIHGIIWINRGSHDIICNDVDHKVPDMRQPFDSKGCREEGTTCLYGEAQRREL